MGLLKDNRMELSHFYFIKLNIVKKKQCLKIVFKSLGTHFLCKSVKCFTCKYVAKVKIKEIFTT